MIVKILQKGTLKGTKILFHYFLNFNNVVGYFYMLDVYCANGLIMKQYIFVRVYR